MKLLAFCLAMIDEESDKQKFEQLYWQYRKLIYYYAYQHLDDDELVEDAVSETLIKIAKNIHMIHDIDSNQTKHLLAIITERTAINVYHKNNREKKKTVFIEDVGEQGSYVGVDEAIHIKEAIKALPDDYRHTMMLKYIDGYSTKEIAVLLNFTVSKVEKLLARGKKKLGRILKEA